MISVDNGYATGTLSEILSYPFAASLAGLKARPVDVKHCDLTWNGTAWSGIRAGYFLTLAAALAVVKTNLSTGTIFVVDGLKYAWDGTNLNAVSAVAGEYESGEREVYGALAAVLATTPPDGTWSEPTDLSGGRIQYRGGFFYGNLGTFASTAARDAAVGAQSAKLAVGGVTCTVSGVQYTWQGAAGGWSSQALIGSFATFLNLFDTTTQIPGNQLLGGYVDDSGVFQAYSGFKASALIPCSPGDVICLAQQSDKTAPSNGGAFYTSALSGTGKGLDYNAKNVAPANSAFFRINIDTTWTRNPHVSKSMNFSRKKITQVFGDSIVRGYYSGSYVITRPWPSSLAFISSRTTVNQGIDSTTISDGTGSVNPLCNRLSSATTGVIEYADEVIIAYGTNDAKNGVTLGAIGDSVNSTFFGAYNNVIKYVKTSAPKARIYLVAPMRPAVAWVASATLDAFAQAVRDLAAYHKCALIDAHRELFDFSVLANELAYAQDGLHPTQEGTDILAQYVASKMLVA